MIIEIRKAGFINKGAELMLLAALSQLRARYPDATYVIAPTPKNKSQPFDKFIKLGLHPKAWLWLCGIQWGHLAILIPRPLREMYGIVLDCEVDVVIDAAGFAYSDQWGISPCQELAASSARWRRQGTKFIMLPQAFGPYSSARINRYANKIIGNADLIFAREDVSYKHLLSAAPDAKNIFISHDFTNLLAGEVPEYFAPSKSKICLVPNARMLDKTSASISEKYVPFFIRSANFLRMNGLEPFILVHEGKADSSLAEKISDAVSGIEVLVESDPIKIKGILGACGGTIGSRFHGLVSALSQGVPSLATGWSHKYQALFKDYDFEDGLIDISAHDEEIEKKLSIFTDPQRMSSVSKKLIENSARLKEQSVQMWEHVYKVLG